MLLRKFIGPNLLLVEEVLMSFRETRRTYWYYDTEKWLVNHLGKLNEAPTRPMSQESIDWCIKYHIPAAEPWKESP